MEKERTRPAKDRTQVTPEPARPDLFRWVENLFVGVDQMPEKIELRQAFGAGGRKYGPALEVEEYKANQAKPTREQLVALSNRFLDLAQTNSNNLGRAHGYGLCARHYAKSDGPYKVFFFKMWPKQRSEEALALDGRNGSNGDGGDGGDLNFDDGDEITDRRWRDGLLHHSLEHLRQGDENRRWEQEQFSTAMGHILERYEGIITTQAARIESLETRHLAQITAVEEALSRKQERDIIAAKEHFKLKGWEQGLGLVTGLLPAAVRQIKGQPPKPGEATAESFTVKQLIEGVTQEQGQKLFGHFKGDAFVGDGILSGVQTVLIYEVARCDKPATALNALIDGGPNAITEAQMMAAREVLTEAQALSLLELIMALKKKQLEDNPK